MLTRISAQHGAGGSYTWGKPGDTDPGPAAMDRNDPNYDSSDDVCIDECAFYH